MNSHTLTTRVVSNVSKVFNTNKTKHLVKNRSIVNAGWVMVLILTFVLLLALFGNGENVSGKVEQSPAKAAMFGGATNPGGVTGQSLWVKADLGLQVSASQQVEQWLDQSGSGNTTTELRASLPAHTNAIAPTNAILRVANGINFNPAVDFSGATGRSLKGNAATEWDVSPVSIFAVALPEGASAGSAIAGVFDGLADWTIGAPGTAGIGLNIDSAGTAYSLDGNGCLTAFTTSSIIEPRVLRGTYITGGNGVNGSTWLNGVQEATGTNCATAATTFFEVGGRTAGDPSFDNRIFNGKITEVVVHKSVLSAANANRIESYLAVKYGITLRQAPAPQNYTASDGTTFFWDAAVNTIYNKNITGIGRDDASGLNQKQSRSVNLPASGNMVTMGLTTIAADNASNTNTFAADLNFLTWGDDGVAASFSTLITPPVSVLATVRTTRIWKVQETGAVGTVKVGIPANLGGGNTVYLVVSNDTTFDAADQYVPLTPLTAGGTAYQAGDFDFTTGQFFAFATLPAIPGGVGSGMALWLKGNDGMNCATDGCLATQWQDQSANGKHANVTAGTLSRINVGVNFNPTLGFDAGDGMRGSSLMGTSTFTNTNVYIVSKKTSVGTTTDFLEYFNPAGTLHLAVHQPFTDNVAYWDAGSADANGRLTAPAGTIVLGQYELKSYNASTTAGQTIPGANQAISKNGRIITSDTTMAAFTGFNAPYQLGGISQLSTGGANTPDGAEEFAEVIVFTSAITGAEQQRIQSYLALKYGITLDQTAPTDYLASDSTVIWNAAANAVYNDDIAGIGRDDVSALNQKQSASINTGNLLTIGLGTIAPDNETNPNSFPANKDFLIWGHNGAGTSFSVPVTGTSLIHMQRIWKVQETAGIPLAPQSVNDVVVRVPASLFTNPFPTLIRSTDESFDLNDTRIPMTLNGANYEATIDFNNADFFTFAQFVQPTAANVSVSGRVLTPDGRGLAGAIVTLTNSQGVSQTVRTSSFGYFRFDEVRAGEIYILSASARSYQFTPQVVSVNDDITDLEVVASE